MQKITGVTGVQIVTAFQFDDGNVMLLKSPAFKKDIRDGDFFSDEQTAELLSGFGNALAEMVETKTMAVMRRESQTAMEQEGRPMYWKRPDADSPFSDN